MRRGLRRLDAALSNAPHSHSDEIEYASGSRTKSAEEILSRKERKVRKESIGITLAAEASKNPFS